MEMHHVNEEALSLSLIKELEPFFKRNGFFKSHACLWYILNNLVDTDEKQLIVRGGNNAIVGCNLFFKSQAYILDHIEDIYWSNSTYLEPLYRPSCGIEFMLRVEERKNIFGFGLTDINIKMQRLLGNTFLGSSVAYMIQVPKHEDELSNRRRNLRVPEDFESAGVRWKRVRHANEMQYPNRGYWNKDKLSIDFVRDEDFIQRRFLNHYKEYYIYKQVQSENSTYFVWRIVRQNDFSSIYLVDYRFSIIDASEQMKCIIDALVYIALLNNLPRVFVFSTIGTPRTKYYTSVYGSPSLIVTNHIGLENPVFITPADSDCELWLE